MSAVATPAPRAQTAPAAVEADCQCCANGALLALFASSALWFAAAMGLTLLASFRFHMPQFLADQPFFTYGRVVAAASDAFLYGFAVQAGIGVGLWLLCRLGQTSLAAPPAVYCGWLFWNTAVTIGVIAILCGSLSGNPAFEMPRAVGPLLFGSFVVLAVCAALTFHNRREGALYPSQWFVLGSVFWFAWIFSTTLLLRLSPERGIAQAVTDGWYGHNLYTVFLGFAGLAPAFYFIPKLLRRPLYSAPLAVLAFWTLALFGSWGGATPHDPTPVWISTMSTVGAIFTSVALIAVASNFAHTIEGAWGEIDRDPVLRFSGIAVIFWVIATAQQIVSAQPAVSALTGLTWFGQAQHLLQGRGFFAFAMFGAIYYIIPRLMDVQWCPKLQAAHFWLMLVGLVVSYLSLVVAGIAEGAYLADLRNGTLDALKASLTGVRVSFLGDVFMFAGSIVFLANFAFLFEPEFKRCREFIMGFMPGRRA